MGKGDGARVREGVQPSFRMSKMVGNGEIMMDRPKKMLESAIFCVFVIWTFQENDGILMRSKVDIMRFF